MNLRNWSDEDTTNLRIFYDSGPVWSFSEISSGADTATQALQKWLENSPPPRRYPLLLPTLPPGSAEPRWYAIAFSDAQAESLRAELTAFLGPVGSNYRGRRVVVDSHHPVDIAAIKWAGGPFVYQFDVLPGFRAVVRAAIERLHQVWQLRPIRLGSGFRTTEALLREFFAALTCRVEVAATETLDLLKVDGRLSSENLQFLKIEYLAAFSRWNDIALDPYINLMIQMRRPRRITAILIEALWHIEFARFLERKDAVGAATHFRQIREARYGTLLRSRGKFIEAKVLLTFLLAAVTDIRPRQDQIRAILDVMPEGPERSFASALALSVPSVADAQISAKDENVQSALDLAEEAYRKDDYETVWVLLKDHPPSARVCGLLLDCAYESNSPDDAHFVQSRIAMLSPEQISQVLSSRLRKSAWTQLLRLSDSNRDCTEPSNWEEWLDLLRQNPGSDMLYAQAQESSIEWNLADYRGNPQRIREIADSLADQNDESLKVLRAATPHVLGFFLIDGEGIPDFMPIYQSLLVVLAVDEQFGTEDWMAVYTLLQAILDSNPTRIEYAEVTAALAEIWSRSGSLSRLDWALDVLDLLAVNPVPDSEGRDRLFEAVHTTINKFYRRVSNEHKSIFRWLAEDYGRASITESLESTNQEIHEQSARPILPDGAKIAIYTLTESAGIRSKQIINRIFPSADVRLNHECTGSDRLRSLAREAEYFLVSSKSAKHAATDFIRNERPRNKTPVIFPKGKGSSSIISALLNAIR